MSSPAQDKADNERNQSPGFFRYLAIVSYDSLLLVALLFLATALILPFNSGEAFTSNQYFFSAYIIFVSFFYYGWFWTHGGQTLGMKTWKVKLQAHKEQKITWFLALKRFLMAFLSWAPMGLGVLWIFIDKKHQTWHDKLSGSSLFFEEKRPLSNTNEE